MKNVEFVKKELKQLQGKYNSPNRKYLQSAGDTVAQSSCADEVVSALQGTNIHDEWGDRNIFLVAHLFLGINFFASGKYDLEATVKAVEDFFN